MEKLELKNKIKEINTKMSEDEINELIASLIDNDMFPCTKKEIDVFLKAIKEDFKYLFDDRELEDLTDDKPPNEVLKTIKKIDEENDIPDFLKDRNSPQKK